MVTIDQCLEKEPVATLDGRVVRARSMVPRSRETPRQRPTLSKATAVSVGICLVWDTPERAVSCVADATPAMSPKGCMKSALHAPEPVDLRHATFSTRELEKKRTRDSHCAMTKT